VALPFSTARSVAPGVEFRTAIASSRLVITVTRRSTLTSLVVNSFSTKGGRETYSARPNLSPLNTTYIPDTVLVTVISVESFSKPTVPPWATTQSGCLINSFLLIVLMRI